MPGFESLSSQRVRRGSSWLSSVYSRQFRDITSTNDPVIRRGVHNIQALIHVVSRQALSQPLKIKLRHSETKFYRNRGNPVTIQT